MTELLCIENKKGDHAFHEMGLWDETESNASKESLNVDRDHFEKTAKFPPI